MESGKPQKKCCLFSARVVGIEIKSTRKKSWEGFFSASRRRIQFEAAFPWNSCKLLAIHTISQIPRRNPFTAFLIFMRFMTRAYEFWAIFNLPTAGTQLLSTWISRTQLRCFLLPIAIFCPMDGWSANKSLECFTKWFESKQKICMHTHTINLHLLYTEQ